MIRLAMLLTFVAEATALLGAEVPGKELSSQAIAEASSRTPQSTDQPTFPLVLVSAGTRFDQNAPLRLTTENRPIVIQMLKEIVLRPEQLGLANFAAPGVGRELLAFSVVGTSADDLAFLSGFFSCPDWSDADQVRDPEIRALYSWLNSKAHGVPDEAQLGIVASSAMDAFAELAVKIGQQDAAVPSIARVLESKDYRTASEAVDRLGSLGADSAVRAIEERLKSLEERFPTDWTDKDEADYAGGKGYHWGMSSPALNYVTPLATNIVATLSEMPNESASRAAHEALERWKVRYQNNPHGAAILRAIDLQFLSDKLREADSKRAAVASSTPNSQNDPTPVPSRPQPATLARPTSATGYYRVAAASFGIISLIVAAVLFRRVLRRS